MHHDDLTGHRLAAWKRVPVARVADEPHVFVPGQRAPAYHDLVVRFCRDVGFTLRVRHEADHPHIVVRQELFTKEARG